MKTLFASVSYSMSRFPPRTWTLTVEGLVDLRKPATAVAQAPVPHASVSPHPRSKTRMAIPVFVFVANSIFAFSGNVAQLS